MLPKRLKGMLRLFRPELPLAAGVCTLTGQILTAGELPSARIALAAFGCVFCLSSSALIVNDYFDCEVDLRNAPDRPLPSGDVSRTDVIGLALATTLLGFFAAATFSLTVLLVSLLIWLNGFLYNWRYKQTGLVGNMMVSLSVAATFLFGAITLQAPWNAVVWTFSLMAFFLDLGEEIAGDAMDMEGDRLRGSRSLALLKGRRFAVRVSVILWGVMIALSLLPAAMGWLGAVYLYPILVTDALLVYFSIRLIQSQDADSGHRAMRGAYLAASLGVAAFLVGRILG